MRDTGLEDALRGGKFRAGAERRAVLLNGDVRRPALLKRFPRLRSQATAEELVPADAAATYPELAGDVSVVLEVVKPAFEELDVTANLEQNRHRRARVTLIVGGLAATILGAIQTAYSDVAWPGAAEAVLGAVLIVLGQQFTRAAHGERFIKARLGAELLRGESFRYLARAGDYAGDTRADTLRRRVADVRRESTR
jgi:Protein of unknown function (DUF4231)